MKKALSIHETKTHMSKLLQDVAKGKKVVFGARGQAEFQIVKLPVKRIDRSKSFGAWKDKVWVAPDAFDPKFEADLFKDFWKEDITDPSKKIQE